jgi:two-component system sensor histidine kinase KdpD
VSSAGEATSEATASQAVDELISILSHELRTPLTAIKGCARTLLRHEEILDAATRRQLLRDIDNEAERLRCLFENLIELARSGDDHLRAELTALDVLIRRVVAEVAPRAEERRIRLHLAASLPPVRADPVRIEQVVRNLLDNAIKYSPAGSPIDVGTCRRRGLIAVTVANEGPGIAREHQGRIFERFYRVEPPGQTAGGAGLGLAICRRFAELHGGRIEVESEPGRGATFCLMLPIDRGRGE